MVLLDQQLNLAVPPDSLLETALVQALTDNGVRGFSLQAPPPWWADGPERVDVTLPPIRVIIEADGRLWHAKVADFERDRRRDNRAGLAGWRVFRYTWHQLQHEREVVDRQLN